MKQSVLNYSSGYHLFLSLGCQHMKKRKKNPKLTLFILAEQKPESDSQKTCCERKI